MKKFASISMLALGLYIASSNSDSLNVQCLTIIGDIFAESGGEECACVVKETHTCFCGNITYIGYDECD